MDNLRFYSHFYSFNRPSRTWCIFDIKIAASRFFELVLVLAYYQHTISIAFFQFLFDLNRIFIVSALEQ